MTEVEILDVEETKPRKRTKARFQIDLIESLRDKNVDVVQEFFSALACIDDPGHKAELLLRLMDFVYPKKKAIDVSFDMTAMPQLSHNEIKQVLASDPFALPENSNEPGPGSSPETTTS